MADWKTLTLAFVVLGFELDVLAIANSNFVGHKNSVEALEICGFLSFLVSFLLVILAKYGDLQGNKAAMIVATVFAFAAAALIVVGLAVYGNKVNENLPPYPTTLLVCAAAFGVLGGVFSLVDLCK